MEIIEVRNTWPSDYFKIEINLGDICNFQCWYCWPEAHAAKYKWPDYDLLVKNLSHLIEYYIQNTNKRKFEISLLGGEVTHWKRFIDFIEHFKTKYDCIITIITNASKSLDWWKTAAKYLSYVYVSHHPQFSKKEHNRELLDYLYEQNIVSLVAVLMDPNCWDKCLETIEYYKQSKHEWTIRYHGIIHEKVNYTPEQNEILKEVRARRVNLSWFFANNKLPITNVEIIDKENNLHKVTDKHIVLQRLNNFKGWDCSLGIDWISIKHDGSISGACKNRLYGLEKYYNIYDTEFDKIFNPIIKSAICDRPACWCDPEANMPKKRN